MASRPRETAQNLHILTAVALFTILISGSQIFMLLSQDYSSNSTLPFESNQLLALLSF